MLLKYGPKHTHNLKNLPIKLKQLCFRITPISSHKSEGWPILDEISYTDYSTIICNIMSLTNIKTLKLCFSNITVADKKRLIQLAIKNNMNSLSLVYYNPQPASFL
jgi:hypothetical protein